MGDTEFENMLLMNQYNMLIGNKKQHDNTSSINKTSTSKQNNNNDEFDEKAANISDVVLNSFVIYLFCFIKHSSDRGVCRTPKRTNY